MKIEDGVKLSLPDVICGIYLLLKGDEVVYVGQSINILARVGTHRSEKKKDFDGFAYIKADPSKLSWEECRMIVKYDPIYNFTLPQAGYGSLHYFKTRNKHMRRDAIRKLLLAAECERITFKGTAFWNIEAALLTLGGAQ